MPNYPSISLTEFNSNRQIDVVGAAFVSYRSLGYERVYLPLCKVADFITKEILQSAQTCHNYASFYLSADQYHEYVMLCNKIHRCMKIGTSIVTV